MAPANHAHLMTEPGALIKSLGKVTESEADGDDVESSSSSRNSFSMGTTNGDGPTAGLNPHQSMGMEKRGQKRANASIQQEVSAEDKKAERRAANRRSAFQSRQRRKILIEDLQRTVASLSKENNDLRKVTEELRFQLDSAVSENQRLRMQQQFGNMGGAAAAAGLFNGARNPLQQMQGQTPAMLQGMMQPGGAIPSATTISQLLAAAGTMGSPNAGAGAAALQQPTPQQQQQLMQQQQQQQQNHLGAGQNPQSTQQPTQASTSMHASNMNGEDKTAPASMPGMADSSQQLQAGLAQFQKLLETATMGLNRGNGGGQNMGAINLNNQANGGNIGNSNNNNNNNNIGNNAVNGNANGQNQINQLHSFANTANNVGNNSSNGNGNSNSNSSANNNGNMNRGNGGMNIDASKLGGLSEMERALIQSLTGSSSLLSVPPSSAQMNPSNLMQQASQMSSGFSNGMLSFGQQQQQQHNGNLMQNGNNGLTNNHSNTNGNANNGTNTNHGSNCGM